MVHGAPHWAKNILPLGKGNPRNGNCPTSFNNTNSATLPDFEGNTYIQYLSYPLLWLGEVNEKYGMDHAESIIRDTLGDESGTYTTLFSMRWDSVFGG